MPNHRSQDALHPEGKTGRGPEGRARPTRRDVFLVAVGFTLAAAIGSLAPFGVSPLAAGETLTRFSEVLLSVPSVLSPSDVLANVLLFVPLGFLWLGAAGVDRSRWVALRRAPLMLAGCAALGLALELAQTWIPARTVSVADLAAQSFGAALGGGLWMVSGQRWTDRMRSWTATLAPRGLAVRLLGGYFAVLVVLWLWPLDVTISPVELYRKYKHDRIGLLPPVSAETTSGQVVFEALLVLAAFVPVGILAATGLRRRRQPVRSWARAMGLGGLAVGTLGAAQVAVISRSNCATDLLTAMLGVAVGVWLARRRADQA